MPAKLAVWAASLAEVLSLHRTALDVTEVAGEAEHDTYSRLVNDFRSVSQILNATATFMAASAKLPMATHDVAVLSSDRSLEVFARYVSAQRDVLEQLQTFLAEDEQMLADWQAETSESAG